MRFAAIGVLVNLLALILFCCLVSADQDGELSYGEKLCRELYSKKALYKGLEGEINRNDLKNIGVLVQSFKAYSKSKILKKKLTDHLREENMSIPIDLYCASELQHEGRNEGDDKAYTMVSRVKYNSLSQKIRDRYGLKI